MNYQSDLSQASNADLAKHLQEQDRQYLDKILENQKKIISMLEESKAVKER
nr:MAG TPA: phosphoprotein [Bacteriophage sp.]